MTTNNRHALEVMARVAELVGTGAVVVEELHVVDGETLDVRIVCAARAPEAIAADAEEAKREDGKTCPKCGGREVVDAGMRKARGEDGAIVVAVDRLCTSCQHGFAVAASDVDLGG